MSIQVLISEIKDSLSKTFYEVDLWFDKGEELRNYKPKNNGWTIDQVLEHIALTNRFLLILIEKGTNKALQNLAELKLEEELKTYNFQKDKLTEIGLHQSFNWSRPEHMEPTGEKSPAEIRQQLKEQFELCVKDLEKLKNGEGVLYKTQMSVNGLGKIDVYEYIYFLAQHAQRHIVQMTKIENEFK